MLDDLHLFIEIARRKSMSQTAKDLGLNLSTLSRRIQALEEKLAEPCVSINDLRDLPHALDKLMERPD